MVGLRDGPWRCLVALALLGSCFSRGGFLDGVRDDRSGLTPGDAIGSDAGPGDPGTEGDGITGDGFSGDGGTGDGGTGDSNRGDAAAGDVPVCEPFAPGDGNGVPLCTDIFTVPSWTPLGSAGASVSQVVRARGSATFGGLTRTAAQIARGTIEISPTGVPHVVWYDELTNRTRVYLVYWDGVAWQELGGSATGDGIALAEDFTGVNFHYPDLAFMPSGAPVVVYVSPPPAPFEVHLQWYNDPNWEEIDGSATGIGVSDSGAWATHPRVVMDGADPIVAWSDDSSGSYNIRLRRIIGGSWQGLSGSDSLMGSSASAVRSRQPDLAIDGQGRIVLAWWEEESTGGEIYALRYDGQWRQMAGSATGGGVSSTPEPSLTPALAVDALDRPVVCWEDGLPGTEDIYVRRFDGAQWWGLAGSDAGDGISGTPAVGSRACSVAVDNRNRVYVAHDQLDGNGRFHIEARAFDRCAWSRLGPGAGDQSISRAVFSGGWPRLAADATGSEVWVVYNAFDGATIQPYARRFDTGTWREVGNTSCPGPRRAEPTTDLAPNVLIDPSGRPVRAFIRRDAAAPAAAGILVQRFDLGTWDTLSGGGQWPGVFGPLGLADTLITPPSLAFNDVGDPIVAHAVSGAGTLGVFMAELRSGSWQPIPDPTQPNGLPASRPIIGLASGIGGLPALTWEASNQEIRVASWDGMGWSGYGGSNGTAGMSNTPGAASQYPSITFRGTWPVVSWSERSSGHQNIFVREFDGMAWNGIDGSDTGEGISDHMEPSFTSLVQIDSMNRPVVLWMQQVGGTFHWYLKRNAMGLWSEVDGSASGNGITRADTTWSFPIPQRQFLTDGDRIFLLQTTNATDGPDVRMHWSFGSGWVGLFGSNIGGGVSNTTGVSAYPSLFPLASDVCVMWAEVSDGFDPLWTRCATPP